MEQPSKKFSVKSFLKSLAREIIVPIVLALVVIQYVIQAFQIPSGSMEDSLLTGDFLLGLKFTYGSPIPFTNQKFPGYAYPVPGDVVIFRYPGEPEYPDNNPQRYTHLFNALMFGNVYWDHEPEDGQPHLVHYPDGPKDSRYDSGTRQVDGFRAYAFAARRTRDVRDSFCGRYAVCGFASAVAPMVAALHRGAGESGFPRGTGARPLA